MTKEQIIRAINKMESKLDLSAIADAVKARIWTIVEREQDAEYQVSWERAKGWALGTTVYPIRERIVWAGDPFLTVHRGERLIVRRIMPRAHAIGFERPDHPQGDKYLLRFGTEELHYFDCQLEPPSGEVAPYTG